MSEVILKLEGTEEKLTMVSGLLSSIGVLSTVVEPQDTDDKSEVLDALILTLDNFRTRLTSGSFVKELTPGMSRERFHELAIIAGWTVKYVDEDYCPDKNKYPKKRYKNVTYGVPGHSDLRFAMGGDVSYCVRLDHRQLLADHLQKRGL